MSDLELWLFLIYMIILCIVVIKHKWAIHDLENEIKRLKEEREEINNIIYGRCIAIKVEDWVQEHPEGNESDAEI